MNELRKIVLLVATLNLAYFGVEFAVAVAIGSVSLFADSIDFLEDTSVNFLIAGAQEAAPVWGWLWLEFCSYPVLQRYGQHGKSSSLHCRPHQFHCPLPARAR